MVTTTKEQVGKKASARPGSPEERRQRARRRLFWFLGTSGLAMLLVGTFTLRVVLARLASGRDGIETQAVQKGRLMVTIEAEGNVASANNAELKCQIAGGAKIISIVPDGTHVDRGAELVQFDRSAFDQQQDEQKILYERAVATKIQAEQDFQAAEIAVREYLDGTFHKDLQTAEQAIVVARQNLDTDKNVLSHTERMFRKGFVTALQLEADKFAVEHAQLDLDSAVLAKKVLQEYTKPKMLKQLESVRDAADARRRSEEASVNLEKAKLERIQQQLKYCVIKAPQRGMVIYANDPDRRGASDSPQIEEGAMVRDRQTIIRLPDLSNMQVETSIHESRVPQLSVGMPARVQIQGKPWKGHISKIASRPATPSGRWNTPTKNYTVSVAIEGNTTGLRPGMTAELELLLADLHDVCTVPVTAVVEQRQHYYAWVNQASGPKRRQVAIGKTDDKVIEIKDGLAAGESVIVNPRATVPEAMKFEDSPQQAAEDDSRFHSHAGTTPAGAAPTNAARAPASAENSKSPTDATISQRG